MRTTVRACLSNRGRLKLKHAAPMTKGWLQLSSAFFLGGMIASELLVKSNTPIWAGLRRSLIKRGNFISGPNIQRKFAWPIINLHHPPSLEGFDIGIPLDRHLRPIPFLFTLIAPFRGARPRPSSLLTRSILQPCFFRSASPDTVPCPRDRSCSLRGASGLWRFRD